MGDSILGLNTDVSATVACFEPSAVSLLVKVFQREG